MKRFYLAVSILLAGTAGVLALNTRLDRLQRELNVVQTAWQVQTQQLVTTETEWTTLNHQVEGLKTDLHLQHAIPALTTSPLAPLLGTNKFGRLTPDQRERLLAELGLNWNSSDQWLLISKSTLHHVGINAIKKRQLTDTAADVLALTMEERQRVNDAIVRTTDQFATWAKANVQREGPAGDVVARYTLPAYASDAGSLTKQFFSAVNEAIGEERGKLMQRYTDYWLDGMSYLGEATNTLTVLNQPGPDGKTVLHYKIIRTSAPGKDHGSSQDGAIDARYFPPSVFKTVFPGGWKELAKREGFTLPLEEPAGGK